MTPIYAEYIDATNSDFDFDKVPNNRNVEFHFILAFASDLGGDGDFKDNLSAKFEKKQILNYKGKHQQTKFILSIGSNNCQDEFQGKGGNTWADKAFRSIDNIVRTHNLDGINICYSKIASGVSEATFANDVGDLIDKLKSTTVIEVASITPNPAVDKHYQKLYDDHKDKIDFVNYRFYDRPKTPGNENEMTGAISDVKERYSGTKLLVGNKTNGKSKGKIPDEEVFFPAYKQLSHQLRGIFGWSANESPDTFQFENDAQNRLTETHSKAVSTSS